jgi:DNA ligase-associated metallophosphoesterase
MDARAQSSLDASRACAPEACVFAADVKDRSRKRRECAITIDGIELLAELSGALLWPDEGLLVVADLHLEKGSAFAVHGVLLPPYDTASTLERLAWVIAHYNPRSVIALGDSFHDRRGSARLDEGDRAALASLQQGRDWVWVAGNHDPEPSRGVGGEFVQAVACGKLQFRHEPSAGRAIGEIAGHLHPSARISQRGRTLIRRCFAADGDRVILPAFGAYAGGLNIRDGAFLKVFRTLAFMAHLLGDHSIYALPANRCLGG